jgi:hypothetical protein
VTIEHALLAALSVLSGVILYLWREIKYWQRAWREEVREHSRSTELFKRAAVRRLRDYSDEEEN